MPDKKLFVLYIPGLGDNKVTGQRLAVRTWRLWGVKAEVWQIHWNDTESWESKQQLLSERIMELNAQGIKVALVGSSAGASAAINTYALHKSHIAGCVLIAGKVNHPAAIGSGYRRNNPAFVESAFVCEKSLATLSEEDRKRIMSRYAMLDGIVPRKDSYIEGVHNKMVPTIGHAFTIGSQIIFGAPRFLRFLKEAATK